MLMVLSNVMAAPVRPEGADMRVTLINQQPDAVAPGDQFDVRIKVENNGSAIAKNVKVKLIDEYPFAVAGENERAIGSLGSLQDGNLGVIAKFTVKVADSAADGTYRIKFAYSIDSGLWIIKEISGINVKSEEATVAVAASSLTPERLAQGSPGKLTVTLKNYAGSPMTNIRAELQVLGTQISPISSTNVRMIERLDGGQSAKVEYSLMPESNANSKIYPVTLMLSYIDTLGNSLKRNETIGIPVFSEPNYDLNIEESKAYTAGSTGQVVISIADTGASGLNYLVMELADGEGYNVISSRKVYVGNLQSDDFETASYDVHILASAKKSVNLAATLTYKDDYNKEYTEKASLPLKVYSIAEAQQYGLMAPVNYVAMIIPMAIQILLLVFAVYMLIDCIKKPVATYKKVLWGIVILTLVGAFIYYFFGRKKLTK